jgi:hypothetical protein
MASTESRRTLDRLMVSVVLLSAFVALVAVLYVIAKHAFPGNSDDATVVLEGQAMSTGHLALGGWSLSLDPFWTVDAVFYAVVELFTGLRSVTLYLVPAIIAALVITVGAALAGRGRRGAGRVAATATVVALLAFPSFSLSNVFLQGALHVGTVLWCLIAFAGLSSGRVDARRGLWGPAVAVVVLAAGILGDGLTVAYGVVPVFAAGLVAMLRSRAFRAGIPAVSAAVASVVLAWVVRRIADAIGTFSIATSHPTASLSQALKNVEHIPRWGASMLGLGAGPLGAGKAPAGLEAVHLLGLVVVVAGVGVAAVGLVRGVVRGRALLPSVPVESAAAANARSEDARAGWMLDDLLVIASVCALGVFVYLTSSDDSGFLRYLTAPVIFGSVLAGRWLGSVATAASSPRLRRGAAVVGLAVIAAFAAGSAFNVRDLHPKRPAARLGRFLESHHLRLGIGDYWSASITTVTTQGAVEVRPVIATPTGHVLRYQRQSAAIWYSDKSFQFLVYNTAPRWGGVDEISAKATFGPVAHSYAVGRYRVLVWAHPVTVSTRGYMPGDAFAR